MRNVFLMDLLADFLHFGTSVFFLNVGLEQWEVWGVKSAVWSVKCEGSTGKWKVWSVECEVSVWSAKSAVWSVKCEVWSVKEAVRSVKCGVWSLECEECSVKCGVWSVKTLLRLSLKKSNGCRGKDTVGTGCLWTIGHLCLGNFRRRLARVYVINYIPTIIKYHYEQCDFTMKNGDWRLNHCFSVPQRLAVVWWMKKNAKTAKTVRFTKQHKDRSLFSECRYSSNLFTKPYAITYQHLYHNHHHHHHCKPFKYTCNMTSSFTVPMEVLYSRVVSSVHWINPFQNDPSLALGCLKRFPIAFL